MDAILGNLSDDASEERQIDLMTVEVSLLFSGFEKVDQTHDGFLSPGDLVRFCKQFDVRLRGRDISAMMWLMDDNRRGKLTFDDVMKFYIRNRDEFSKSGQDFHCHKKESKEIKDEEDLSKKVIQTGFGAFGVENENARGRVFDGEEDEAGSSPPMRGRKSTRPVSAPSKRRMFSSKPHGGQVPNDVQELTVTSGDMRSQPLLLFRILFYVAMQDERGELHLLSAFQNLSQLFGRDAEEKFSCIFLRNCLDLEDTDRETLGGFVEHLKKQKLAVKKVRLQLNVFK